MALTSICVSKMIPIIAKTYLPYIITGDLGGERFMCFFKFNHNQVSMHCKQCPFIFMTLVCQRAQYSTGRHGRG